MKRTTLLTSLAVITAAIHLYGEYSGPALLIYIFKPLTMLLIIGIALSAAAPQPQPRYKTAVIAGLLFSLVGDVLLMLPIDAFIFGLVSFLAAHLVYIYAFQLHHRPGFSWLPVLILAAYGVAIFLVLRPGLGGLAFPVAAYILVILTMAYTAWSQRDQSGARWALLALVGAVLFVLSDTILALNKFGEPFTLARALTLGTYFPAQWFIARSIDRSDQTAA